MLFWTPLAVEFPVLILGPAVAGVAGTLLLWRAAHTAQRRLTAGGLALAPGLAVVWALSRAGSLAPHPPGAKVCWYPLGEGMIGVSVALALVGAAVVFLAAFLARRDAQLAALSVLCASAVVVLETVWGMPALALGASATLAAALAVALGPGRGRRGLLFVGGAVAVSAALAAGAIWNVFLVEAGPHGW